MLLKVPRGKIGPEAKLGSPKLAVRFAVTVCVVFPMLVQTTVPPSATVTSFGTNRQRRAANGSLVGGGNEQSVLFPVILTNAGGGTEDIPKHACDENDGGTALQLCLARSWPERL